MRKKDIEKNLNKIISDSVPDVLNNILEKCEEKKGQVNYMEKEVKVKNKFSIPKLATAFAAIIIVGICGVFGINKYNGIYKADSIIEFDVNPSVELEVNKDEEVIKVTPLNKDGEKILDDMDFDRVDLDIAVNAIIGSMLKNGYITIDENSILVSVKNSDAKKADKLKAEITEEIKEILSANSIEGSILSQTYEKDDEVKELASKNNLSEGKVKLIKKILASDIKDSKGNKYSFETLSKLSINELNVLLTSKKTEVKDVNTSGTASEKSYIGKDKAKELAFNNALVSATNVRELEVELDADNGMLVYEVEFKSGNMEYDYEINAKTGEIIHKETEIDDDYTYQTNNNSINNNHGNNNQVNNKPSDNLTNDYDSYDDHYNDDDDDYDNDYDEDDNDDDDDYDSYDANNRR